MSQQHRYGASQNPFDERGNTDAEYADSFGHQQYPNTRTMGGNFSGQNVELQPLTQNGPQSASQNKSYSILDECGEINEAIEELRRNLKKMQRLQNIHLGSVNPTGNNPELEDLSSEIMSTYRNLVDRVRNVKSKPESGSPIYASHIRIADSNLKKIIRECQAQDVAFDKKLKDQTARQYRIVNPNATEEEVWAVVESDNPQQIFFQAMNQTNRVGQANTTLRAVEDRSAAIQKILRQLEELNQLFIDMDTLVVQQEVAVTNIEMKGEEVVENVENGTKQIGVAIESAKNTRKWKWWCLGISVLIVIIIVIVVLIYIYVIRGDGGNNNNNNAKRFVLPESLTTLAIEARRVIPGSELTSPTNIVARSMQAKSFVA